MVLDLRRARIPPPPPPPAIPSLFLPNMMPILRVCMCVRMYQTGETILPVESNTQGNDRGATKQESLPM